MNTTPSTATKPLKLLNNSNNDTHNNNKTSQTLSHNHLDYVLSMSFDYYGRRFATSSGDRTVRVWNLNNNDGMWSSQGVFTAARGPVQSLSWAPAEFGQLIATAGAGEFIVYRILCVLFICISYYLCKVKDVFISYILFL